MSGDVDARQVRELRQRVREMAKATRANVVASLPGSLAGYSEPSDDEFLQWVEERSVADPLWLVTRPFVVGGAAVLSRYERLRGLRQEGEPPIADVKPYETPKEAS